MLKAIIFDLDGVICSTDEFHYQAWKSLAEKMGIPFDRTVNNRLRGVSRMESLEIVLSCGGPNSLNKDEKQMLASEKNETYRRLLQHMSEKDLSVEVSGTLNRLRQEGYKLAIGSSSKNTPMILEHLGLANFFDAVADGNCITRSKPDPEVFLKAAEMLGVAPEEALVVEDAVSGAQAGHAGGFTVACVGDASAAKAGDYNMKSFAELLRVVNSIA